MSRHERMIGEAVASLTTRLESWQVDDAAAKAHEYVQDMLRAGWRPVARDATPPTVGQKCDDPSRYLAEARAAVAAARRTEDA